MMTTLTGRGLARSTFLWSDDNLSNDYFWTILSEADRELIAGYPNYGRVCCFKGFNASSFAFNTQADPSLFSQQFSLMARLLTINIDLYAYVTLTTPTRDDIADDVRRFIDHLQQLHPNLPLKTVPLEVKIFTPVQSRIRPENARALKNQYIALDVWRSEIASRYSSQARDQSIALVSLRFTRP